MMASSSRPGQEQGHKQQQQQQQQDNLTTLPPDLHEELDFYLKSRLDHVTWLSNADQRRIRHFTALVQRDPQIKSAVAQRLADLASPNFVDNHSESESENEHNSDSLPDDLTPDLEGSDDLFSMGAPSSLGRAEEKVQTPTRIARRKAATWREYQNHQNSLVGGVSGGGGGNNNNVNNDLQAQHENLGSRREYDVMNTTQGIREGTWHEGKAESVDGGEHGDDEAAYHKHYSPRVQDGQGQQENVHGKQRRQGQQQERIRHGKQQQGKPSQSANASGDSDPHHEHNNTSPQTMQEAMSLYQEATERWKYHMKAAVQAEADASRASFFAVLLTTTGDGEDAQPGSDDDYNSSSSTHMGMGAALDKKHVPEEEEEDARNKQHFIIPMSNARLSSTAAATAATPALAPPPWSLRSQAPQNNNNNNRMVHSTPLIPGGSGRGRGRGSRSEGGSGGGMAGGLLRRGLNQVPAVNLASDEQQHPHLESHVATGSRLSFSSISQQQQQAALEGLGLVAAASRPTTADRRRMRLSG